jgi:hypothetical protein
MTNQQQISLINTIKEHYFEKNLNALQKGAIAEIIEIDQFLVQDILHLLNIYQRDLRKREFIE